MPKPLHIRPATMEGLPGVLLPYAQPDIDDGKGCYKLTLSSNAKRERALAFYESLGFERNGYSFRVDLAERPA